MRIGFEQPESRSESGNDPVTRHWPWRCKAMEISKDLATAGADVLLHAVLESAEIVE
ncbi:hypothetical protein [Stappia sp.]|uniref:hypothetical protein n=1 Tax=Stappia sp. TaxID=1870903 RepID=UPI0032D8E28C